MFKIIVDKEHIFCYTVITRNEQMFEVGQEGEKKTMRTQRRRKKYRITSKFRFITSLIIMFGLAIAGFNALTGSDTAVALTKPQHTQIEVCYGDTLWDIAQEYKSEDMDTRKAVYEICKTNDIDADDLEPGMKLLIPEKL